MKRDGCLLGLVSFGSSGVFIDLIVLFSTIVKMIYFVVAVVTARSFRKY